jgi:uncharacterized protein YfaS (alpha-2-macroglobulin family)
MVETPLPAGVEPVDPNLAAVSPDFLYGPPELTAVNPPQGGVWTPSFTDFRDDKVTLFATYLPCCAVRIHLPGARLAPRRVPACCQCTGR